LGIKPTNNKKGPVFTLDRPVKKSEILQLSAARRRVSRPCRPAVLPQNVLHLVLQLEFLFLEGDFFELLGL
jgi:hypothetical protein